MKNDSGTAISKSIDGVWKLIFVLVITCLSWQVQAACTFFDGFIDNKDGTVTDPRNGLIWKRCAEGFEWNGSACQGSNKSMNWFDAMQIAKQSRFLGKADWRIPSRAEFENVLGSDEDCGINDLEVGEYAASGAIAHALDESMWPGEFWSTSHKVGDDRSAYIFYFRRGGATEWLRSSDEVNVRLVRTGQSSGGKAALEFETEYAKVVRYTKEIAAKEAARKAKEEADAARRAKEQAREYERRAREERERNANACNRFYTGKAIGFKPAGFIYFGNVLDAVVLGKGSGYVSIKITDTHFDSYGKTLEVPCASDQLQ